MDRPNAPRPIDWIPLAGSWFHMGGGPKDNENPRHRVWVDAFRLARAPVTRGEYERFLTATGHTAPPFWSEPVFSHLRMPAIGPSWNDANAYCRWLSDQLGEDIRLPTEAEWEHAARAGREVEYPWGDFPPEELPNYSQRWLEGPEPVDAYPSLHPLGFFGLGENVHEWCADWYQADYYSVSPEKNPRGPETGRRRASRGGAWRHQIKGSRCAARSSIPPHAQYSDYGFRLAAGPAEATRSPTP